MTTINTNLNAQMAANAVSKNERAMTQTMERLSTGLRINSAKDDAAGLGIATRMTTQVNGLNQAIRNANDAISLIATADGAAVEITDMLQRMRELSVQAANQTNSAADVTNINVEFKQLATGIEQIANNTQFNGMNILNGEGRSGADTDGSFTFNLGANAAQTETLKFNDFTLGGGAGTSTSETTTTSVTTALPDPADAVQAVYDFASITDAALTAAKQAGTDITLDIDGTSTTIDVSTLGSGSAATKATTSFAFTDEQVALLEDSGDLFTVVDGNAVTYSMGDMESFTAVSQVVDKWNDTYAASSGLTASEAIDSTGATTHFVLTQTDEATSENLMEAADIVFTFVEDTTTAAATGAVAAGVQTHVGAADSAADSQALTVADVVADSAFSSAINGFNLTDESGVLRATQVSGASFTGTMTSSLGDATEITAGVDAIASTAVAAEYSFASVTDAALTAAKQAGTDITLDIDGTSSTIDVATLGTDAVKASTSFAFTDAQVALLEDSGDGFTVVAPNGTSYGMSNMEAFTAVSQVVDKWNDSYAASSGLTASEALDASGATEGFVLTQTDAVTSDNLMVMPDVVFTFVEDTTTAAATGALAGDQTETSVNSSVASLTVADVVADSAFSSAINGFNLTDESGVLTATQAVGAAFTGTMTSSLGDATEITAGASHVTEETTETTETTVSPVTGGGVMGADLSGMLGDDATITASTEGVLAMLDAAITGIEAQRASFGAMSNRLEHAVDNLTNVSQNASASLSRIQDADYAAETTELARTQIIAQAATAMLSQANQQAQSVLALLK